jgi:hypothetical protein
VGKGYAEGPALEERDTEQEELPSRHARSAVFGSTDDNPDRHFLGWLDDVDPELTRVSDTKKNGKADRFETISDAWGYANYHEYAFGSNFDEKGNLHVALGLSHSYESHALFRGFVMQVTPDGKTKALASGLRSPGGIGYNEHGADTGPIRQSSHLVEISQRTEFNDLEQDVEVWRDLAEGPDLTRVGIGVE